MRSPNLYDWNAGTFVDANAIGSSLIMCVKQFDDEKETHDEKKEDRYEGCPHNSHYLL